MVPYEGDILIRGHQHISDGGIISSKGGTATYFCKAAFLDGGSIPSRGGTTRLEIGITASEGGILLSVGAAMHRWVRVNRMAATYRTPEKEGEEGLPHAVADLKNFIETKTEAAVREIVKKFDQMITGFEESLNFA